tara:strand:- start:123 stop:914 length:792 start_codon:yes stop_codon:yes gene_type:complete
MLSEATVRFAIFIGLFIVLATLERYAPRRPRHHQISRWVTNWLLVIVDTISLRALAILLPFAAVLAAADATTRGWGLLNMISLPRWVELIVVILLLDLAIWLQHFLSHKIPVLWRIHQVHHSDIEFDVTTAIRFHPIEILLSMAFKIGLVYVLGPTAWSVVIFEILLNGSTMFNHANIALPQRLDRLLRSVLVTPDMHRIHHSVHRHEHDTNFGFALSCWDRVFHTYTQNPQDGHNAMEVGLQWRDLRPTRLLWSLTMPFFRK